MRRVYIWSNGCEQRNLEKEYFRQVAKKNDDEVVTTCTKADVALIITCCVSNVATQKAIEEIKNCIDENVNTVVYGCLPGIKREWLTDYKIHNFAVYQRDKLIQDMKWEKLVPFPCLADGDIPCQSLNEKSPREKFDRVKKAKKIVIADGCLNKCAYCVIHFATGRLMSRSIPDIVEEWNRIVEPNDCIMLMAGDTGAYGMDNGTNLPALLRILQKQSKHAEIYLHDLNIRWMKGYLNEFCKVLQSGNKIKGMTMPIQSGSNKILCSMNRHYTVEDIRTCFNRIHGVDKTLILGTHVIIGYPGESEKDFEETVGLLWELPLDFISCFPYSEHEKAASAKIFPKVCKELVNKRMEILASLFGRKLKIYK